MTVLVAILILGQTRVESLELEHFLLQPMQRLTRYPLLIGQVLRYVRNALHFRGRLIPSVFSQTDADAQDHPNLKRCLQVAEGVLLATNEAMREQEMQHTL